MRKMILSLVAVVAVATGLFVLMQANSDWFVAIATTLGVIVVGAFVVMRFLPKPMRENIELRYRTDQAMKQFDRDEAEHHRLNDDAPDAGIGPSDEKSRW